MDREGKKGKIKATFELIRDFDSKRRISPVDKDNVDGKLQSIYSQYMPWKYYYIRTWMNFNIPFPKSKLVSDDFAKKPMPWISVETQA